MSSHVVSLRLRNQKLVRSNLRAPVEIVSWLGAVQSQDYAGAKWALSLRAPKLTDADVDRAFDEGTILRTHILRPTWHFVAPADIRWMQVLTGPRVLARSVPYHHKLELDKAVFARTSVAVRPFRPLSRPEKTALTGAVARYGTFTNLPAKLVIV